MQVPKSSSGFAFVNKSYLPDLAWSLRLYASFEKFSASQEPFYLVVPRSDVPRFTVAFDLYRGSGSITGAPHIIAEEELFETVGITIPEKFDGWRIQQVVKLAFGLTGLADAYVTIDSAILFAREFRATDLVHTDAGYLKTNARRISRSRRAIEAAQTKEQGWLQDNLVSISEAFDAISRFIGDVGDETHHYVSGTCIFSSFAIKQLDVFAKEKGLSGLEGLIAYSPYECAWYGDFVYVKRPIPFHPTEPNIMWPCVTMEQLKFFESCDYFMTNNNPGILFNPPAVTNLKPEEAFDLISLNNLYRSRAMRYFENESDHLFYPDYLRYRPTYSSVGLASGVLVDGAEIQISGISGCALYGPYLSLSPGLWQLVVVGACENSSKGKISFEIVQAGPTAIRVEWQLVAQDSAVLTQKTFSISSIYPTEIKIYCDEAVSLRIQEFILLKLGPP